VPGRFCPARPLALAWVGPVPADFGVSNLLTSEYNRFTSAVSHLSDPVARAAAQAAVRKNPERPESRYINVPGWNDVIQIGPRDRVTPEERALHYRALREGRPSPLPAERLAQLGRERARLESMRNSATPEYIKALGQIATAIDNVQDLLTSLVVAGRLVLNPIARLASLAAGPETGLLLRAGIMGGRLAARAVPGLGWILLASDLLNLLNLIGGFAFPIFGAICDGPRGALAAGIPGLLLKRGLKKKLTGVANLNPFSRAARIDRAARASRIAPSVFNILEVAQTTRDLFGFGLSYGGIWGLVNDAAFGVERATRGEPVSVSTPTGRDLVGNSYRDVTQTWGLQRLRDSQAAAQLLATSPALGRENPLFTTEEHIEHLVALLPALELLRPLIEHPATPRLMEQAMHVQWRPPLYSAWDTVRSLQRAGEIPEGPVHWALPGAPAAILGRELVESTHADIGRAWESWMAPIRNGYLGSFAGAVSVQLIERLVILLTGTPDGVEWELVPDWQIIESLAEAGLLVNPREDLDAILRFWESCKGWLIEHNRRQLPPDALQALGRAAGLTLIVLRGPDTPMPAEMRAWLAGESPAG
jgi:hypothetical protein